MAQTYYRGIGTYVIYGEETSYGAGGTPSGTNKLGKVRSVSISVNNNQFLVQGLGDGANATDALFGALDVTGSVEFQVSTFDFLRYAVGIRDGAGTVGSPYRIVEKDCIGYGATLTPSLALEIGATGCGGAGGNDVWKLTGVVFNTATLNFKVGDIVTATVDFTARWFEIGTTLTSVTPDLASPFVFTNLDAQRASTSWFGVQEFSLTIAANPFIFRDLSAGERAIKQPARGIRRYEWNMTIKKIDDAVEDDYKDARADLMSDATQPTTTAVPNFSTLKMVGDQGFGPGAKHFTLQLENSTFTNVDEKIEVEDGLTEAGFKGTALSALTAGADKVLVTYYTEA